MNRAQMVEKAAAVVASADGAPFARLEHLEVADAVLDAVLPQVSTLAELEALPIGSVLIDSLGAPWERNDDGEWKTTEWDAPVDPQQVLSGGGFMVDQPRAPLTVVWQPEVTA